MTEPTRLPFELQEKIAQGGFGEVWRGRALPPSGTGTDAIAVKFLRLDRAGPAFLELFKREFEILSEIRHVHLARVFDFGFDASRNLYYFTQEFCEGIPLDRSLKERGPDFFEDFEEILVQVLSALDYIHSQGVIHFDIKPENILVLRGEASRSEGRPEAKLVDFGIAGRLGSLTGGRGGTLAYMAPETFDKKAKIDHRLDLYALGMTCFHVLAGAFPFETLDPEEVILWHQKGSIPKTLWDAAAVPTHLRELIEKLLQKSPSQRFSSAKVALNFLNLSTGRKYLKEEEGLLGQIPTEGPLVERRAEVLEPLLKRLRTPGLIAVRGPKGIGKSRVLEEVRRALELEEVPICLIEGDWQVAAWPRLSEWLGLPPLPESEMAEDWRIQRRIDAVLQSAGVRPFCLIIDDAHKADAEMKAFLEGLNTAPGLFVLISSEDAPDLGGGGGGVRGGAEDFRLERISREGVERYVRLVLGEGGDKEEMSRLASLLHQYSGGLPLLMVEGLKFLAPHFARGEVLENLLPPPEVGQLYRPAVESLTADERGLLLTSALLFRPAELEELTEMLEASPAEVAVNAGTCARKGLLAERRGEEPFRVSSQALALGLIRSLEAGERRRLHARIARGLQTFPAASPREIAYHLAKAGETELAARYFRDAADGFRARGEISSATDCLVRAIQFLGQEAETWEALALEVTRLLILSGEYSEASEYLKRLETRPSPERDELKGWLAFKQRRFPEAREAYARTLQALPGGGTFKRILLENSLANIDLQDGRPFEAAGRFRKTREWEARLEPAERAKVINNNLGIALSLLGDLAGAQAFYEERLKGLGDRGNAAEELACLSGLGYIALQSSQYGKAVVHLVRAMELAERTGAFHTLFSSAGNLITALLKEGRYAESLSYLQKMVSYQRRMGTLRDVAYNLLRQGDVYLTLGMAEASRECFQKGQKAAVESGQAALGAWFLLMDGYWEREFGDPSRSRQLFLQTELEAAKISQEDLATWAVFALADLAHDMGEADECRRHLERIVPGSGMRGDEEFAARLDLLRLKANPAVEDRERQYVALEKTCLDRHFREILWELYESWGRAELADGRSKQALHRLEQGITSVDDMVSSLPEEYRDRYLGHGGRQRLLETYRDLSEHAPKGIGLRMKRFLAPLRKHLHLH